MSDGDGKTAAAGLAEVLRRRRRSPVKRVQDWLDLRVAALLRLLYRIPAQRYRKRGHRLLAISNPTRIGHLAAEPDWYLKRIALGEDAPRRAILMVRKSANPALLSLWRPHLDVVTEGFRYRLLRPLLHFPDLVIDLGEGIVATEGAADYARVQCLWHGRAPLLALPGEMERQGRAALRRMGVPEGAWFVCVHAREGGYAPKDEFVHAHRNSSIADMAPAIDAIVARGGWCIRMGDPTMVPMAPRDGLIDYALSPEKSPATDVFLCARARFFLGNTSGLSVLAGAFGVRSALVNMIPHAAALGVGADDIVIPKLLARSDGALLGFAEIHAREIANYRAAELFQRDGITVIDNTPEEIRDLVLQMLHELDGIAAEDDRDRSLQAAYRALLRPSHYSYHAKSRVGRAFLSAHAGLLDT